LSLGRREVHVGRRKREDFDIDADAVHVLDASRRIGHRRRDAEEPRAAIADDRATRRIGAEGEGTADLFDEAEERFGVVVGVEIPAHARKVRASAC
jgi:hypothetical protein